jgi:hypothetical protein
MKKNIARKSMWNVEKLGLQIPEILLPKNGIDLHKWAVIACDQFTSEPEYWKQVEETVGNSPSTYNMILPEIFLNTPVEDERLVSTRKYMTQYLTEGLLEPRQGLILVERKANGKTRHGVMLALDLERYDYSKGSQSLIRATEGTILDRLPPRIKIREGAPLEIPHILVLIDDPEKTTIEPLFQQTGKLSPSYDFDLMLGSGHLKGQLLDDKSLIEKFLHSLESLTDPKVFNKKYALKKDEAILLFAMGDGNHSLATAKAIWEKKKQEYGMDHPSRYALVEVENIHDDGLEFEPIHRVLFNVKENVTKGLKEFYKDQISIQLVKSQTEMTKIVCAQVEGNQVFGLIDPTGFSVVRFLQPAHTLTVGSLQPFLDEWVGKKVAEKIDYVHGNETVCNLGSKPGNAGFFLPTMKKTELFRTVIIDGVLPRKTFSMGEAKEKRFYMESRRIVK